MIPALLRAVTIRQPYAALIVEGRKRVETRSWRTHYRGWLAIHAAKRPALTDYPTSAIVAVARLRDVIPVERLGVSAAERSVGDYAPGRFGWVLDDVHVLRTPVPHAGALGLWPVDDAIAEQLFATLHLSKGRALCV